MNQRDFAVRTKVQTSDSKTFLRGANLTLPTPIKEYQHGDAHFFIYKVKDKNEQIFPNSELHALLLEARRSYLRYGDVPLIDSYDAKSSIYLTRVLYNYHVDNVTFPIEEWVSVRFVPGQGTPVSTEDLDVCVYQNQPLMHTVQKTLLAEKSDPLSHVVTISRICRIAPRVPMENVFFSGTFLPQKNAYTALAFTAMNQLFFEESSKNSDEYLYYTALAKPELFEKVLFFQTADTKIHFPFSPIREILNLTDEAQLRVKRNILSYKHPGYFLHIGELMALLGKLIEFGRLSENTFQKFFHTGMSFSEFQSKQKTLSYHEFLPLLNGLSDLLLTDGWIEGSRMHGTELRSLVDICVSDAVQLYMSPAPVWQNHMNIISQEFFSTATYESKTDLFRS